MQPFGHSGPLYTTATRLAMSDRPVDCFIVVYFIKIGTILLGAVLWAYQAIQDDGDRKSNDWQPSRLCYWPALLEKRHDGSGRCLVDI